MKNLKAFLKRDRLLRAENNTESLVEKSVVQTVNNIKSEPINQTIIENQIKNIKTEHNQVSNPPSTHAPTKEATLKIKQIDLNSTIDSTKQNTLTESLEIIKNEINNDKDFLPGPKIKGEWLNLYYKTGN